MLPPAVTALLAAVDTTATGLLLGGLGVLASAFAWLARRHFDATERYNAAVLALTTAAAASAATVHREFAERAEAMARDRIAEARELATQHAALVDRFGTLEELVEALTRLYDLERGRASAPLRETPAPHAPAPPPPKRART